MKQINSFACNRALTACLQQLIQRYDRFLRPRLVDELGKLALVSLGLTFSASSQPILTWTPSKVLPPSTSATSIGRKGEVQALIFGSTVENWYSPLVTARVNRESTATFPPF